MQTNFLDNVSIPKMRFFCLIWYVKLYSVKEICKDTEPGPQTALMTPSAMKAEPGSPSP